MPKIKQIIADEKNITFVLDSPIRQTSTIEIFTPSVNHTSVDLVSVDIFGTRFSVPRFADSKDRLTYHFVTEFEGPSYVTDITSKYTYNYPTAPTKKGLRAANIQHGVNLAALNDSFSLGSHHDSIDLDIPDLMSVFPYEHSDTYIYNDETYYINLDKLDVLDEETRILTWHDVTLTITLLVYADVKDKKLIPYVRHPDYDGMGKVAMFNVVTDEGMNYYEAICHFLAERYTRPDRKYGNITGIIIGNEASVQGAWCNAGDKTMQQFVGQYMTAMRAAWQVGVKFWSNWRVYASFDNHWNEAFVPQLDKKFYKGREMLEYMIEVSHTDGDFGWHIAHHPYTSNLINAAFWNDEDATFDYKTSPVVSFKNLVLLVHFVKIPQNMYKGKPRVIILSEQGFNGVNRTMEFTQALAYAKSYKVVMAYPEVESVIYHSQFDHPTEEHGLQLGIWRTETVGDVEQDARPIYNIMKYIDQPVKGQPDKKLYELY